MTFDNKSFNNKNSYNKSFNNKNIKPEPTFPERYLKEGYFKDENKKILRSEYIVEYPKHIVKNLKDGEKNKSSQLRKYYDFVVRIKDTLKYDTKTFEEVYPEINKLAYHTNYAQTRIKVTKYFTDFINMNLENINTKEDFFAFATHFEAIIAYLPKEK